MASAKSVRLPYLRVIGITEVTGVGGRMTDTDFTPEEETKFRQMAAMPVYLEKKRKTGTVHPCLWLGKIRFRQMALKACFRQKLLNLNPQLSTSNPQPNPQP